jgi:hypothetical protein
VSSFNELNFVFLVSWVPDFLNISNLLSEIFGADNHTWVIHFFLGYDAGSECNLSTSFNMISTKHSHVNFLADIKLLIIVQVIILNKLVQFFSKLDQLNTCKGVLSQFILEPEGSNIDELLLYIFSETRLLDIVVEFAQQVIEFVSVYFFECQ